MREESKKIILNAPLDDQEIQKLRAGEMLYISGTIYTGRDAAHKCLFEIIKDGAEMPFGLKGQVIYYAGPCPAKPERAIGSVGPTTGGRMDAYSPLLIEKGLKVMIGKGTRNREVIDSIIKHKGIYFAAIGGAAALMAQCILKSEIVAFDELGTEAIRRLEISELPVIVAVDSKGNDIYQIGRSSYKTI